MRAWYEPCWPGLRGRSVPAHHRRKNDPVPRIFITGSTDGLGRAAAGVLMGEGHEVVLHARTRERASALSDLARSCPAAGVNDNGRRFLQELPNSPKEGLRPCQF